MTAFFDIIVQTLTTLWAHKLRSFLTMFGIAWGVGSLLLLVGVGEGFRSGNEKQLATIGENAIFLFNGQAPAMEGQHTGLRPYSLTYGDYLDIRDQVKEVRNVAPSINRSDLRAVSEYGNMAGQVMGVTPNFNQIRYLPMKSGRWLRPADDGDVRFVAVIGSEVVKNLFSGHPALGSSFVMHGVRFQVIGIMDLVGRGENVGPNSRIVIPIHTMMKFFPSKNVKGPQVLSFINYQPQTRAGHELAKFAVHKVIARNHGFDYHHKEAFQEWDTVKSMEAIGKIVDAMNLFLGSVGLITLVLGAIGVVNIMLVSVAERTPEIGLRKALGATNRSVLLQFFCEGAFITLVSGGIGMAAAAGFMKLLGLFTLPPGFDTPQLVPSSAALTIGALGIAGIVSGVYPARKAALLDPVEALRRE